MRREIRRTTIVAEGGAGIGVGGGLHLSLIRLLAPAIHSRSTSHFRGRAGSVHRCDRRCREVKKRPEMDGVKGPLSQVSGSPRSGAGTCRTRDVTSRKRVGHRRYTRRAKYTHITWARFDAPEAFPLMPTLIHNSMHILLVLNDTSVTEVLVLWKEIRKRSKVFTPGVHVEKGCWNSTAKF